MDQAQYLFGDIVVVENNLIGVIVKTWETSTGPGERYHYEVYVRNYNSIIDYAEEKISRYRVRHKELFNEELEYQNN